MVLRNCVRHSVTVTVKTMYSTSAAPVIHTNSASNFTPNMVSTSASSMMVGTMLYSDIEMSECTPRVPRSMSRVMPPVWRSR
ncbi:hypothetical protein D3C72_1235490 [compost metagenome]